MLVIIDDLGFTAMDRIASEHLFRFVAAAYEKRSLIVSTNMISTCSLPLFNSPLPAVDGARERHRRQPAGRVGIYLATGGDFQLAAVSPVH